MYLEQGRNAGGEVYLYAEEVSEAMKKAVEETNRRRAVQEAYNREHGITPRTIQKSVRRMVKPEDFEETPELVAVDEKELEQQIADLELAMWAASQDLDFERAAELRDQLRTLEAQLKGIALPQATPPSRKKRRRRR
jgi:excinuclease ABC subunit B